MKQIFFVTISLVMLLCGCDKTIEPDMRPTTIVGEWYQTGDTIVYLIDGEIICENVWTKTEEEIYRSKYIFRPDGAGSMMQNFHSYGKDDWQMLETFVWRQSKDGGITYLAFTNKQFIDPMGVWIDRVFPFAETDWKVLKLTPDKMVVSYTEIVNDPQFVPEFLRNEQNHHIVTFERVE